MDDCRWWTVARDVTAGVARRLPSALIGTAMLVTFAGILGPTWGAAVALGWLAAGALVLTRPGERLAATTVMRYRPAPKSWLAADVRQLAPGRRIDVYVAPKATGVFALGGHTVAIGERSVDAGTRTAALQAAARSAVAELRAGRTRPELAMGWWSGPWLFAKLTAGAFLPPRWYPFFRLFGSVMVSMSVVTCLGHGQPVAAGLGVCLLADLALDYLGHRCTRTLPDAQRRGVTGGYGSPTRAEGVLRIVGTVHSGIERSRLPAVTTGSGPYSGGCPVTPTGADEPNWGNTMKRNRRSLTVVLAAVVLLSGCGPAANGPATSAGSDQSSTSSADIAETSTPSEASPAPVVPALPATAPTTNKPKPPVVGTALAAVAKLTVKGRAPKTGYTRAQFGQAWFDTDKNGCDTRNDILRRDLKSRQMQNACKVLAGTLAPDPYTGTSIRFVYGGASEVDIDHLVALSDAWQKGAASWSAGKRLALANDPLNLLAVDSSTNRSKGDGDAATWLPPNKAFRCTYVARQVAVKGKYAIWVTSAERDAMTRVLATCPSMPLPGPGSASTVVALPAGQPAPQPAPVPAPAAGVTYYANCDAVRAAGAAPIRRGDPGYASKLDRDGDGIGCE